MDLRLVRKAWRAKQRLQRSIVGWVTKIYYFVHLRVSQGTLSRWSSVFAVVSTLGWL
jgi:hypothetical protein